MVINMPKHGCYVYYNKTMVNFRKCFSSYISTTLVKETEYYVINICSLSGHTTERFLLIESDLHISLLYSKHVYVFQNILM